MAVRSLKNSTLENFSNYSSSMNAGYDFNDFELIESVFVASPTASVSFNNLNQYSTEYKHLQIRAVARSDFSSWVAEPLFRVNGITTNSYAFHRVAGGGTSVFSDSVSSQSSMSRISITGATSPTSSYGVAVIDLLDAYSTTKNKTFRILNGNQSGSSPTVLIQLASGGFFDTQAVSSLSFELSGSNFVSGSRFSLYGIR
jgi:hypothetical protein